MAVSPDKLPDSPMTPQPGDLRFVDRDGKKMLQRYEYSYFDDPPGWKWYDVPLVEAEQE